MNEAVEKELPPPPRDTTSSSLLCSLVTSANISQKLMFPPTAQGAAHHRSHTPLLWRHSLRKSWLSGMLQSFLVAVVTVYSLYKHSEYRLHMKTRVQKTVGTRREPIEPLDFQLDMWVSTSVASTFMSLWSGGTASARPRTLPNQNVLRVNGSRISCQ